MAARILPRLRVTIAKRRSEEHRHVRTRRWRALSAGRSACATQTGSPIRRLAPPDPDCIFSCQRAIRRSSRGDGAQMRPIAGLKKAPTHANSFCADCLLWKLRRPQGIEILRVMAVRQSGVALPRDFGGLRLWTFKFALT